MKKILHILTLCFSLSLFAAEADDCGPAKISYKVGGKITTLDVEICKNEYSQIYSNKCADGCDFKKALKAQKKIAVEDATIGSPGGQICNELNFKSRIVEVEFKGKKTPYVDLCFTADQSNFVSTGFLSDLNNGSDE